MNTPHFTIGVAGHVDHGKTTLVRALTGVDTDRKAEEKARGFSIESGVAELKLPGGRSVAMIDVPGHIDFLKNTIRGLNGVDMAILVVAADDGVMPQTREHLDILTFFNAAAGMVVLSKTDLVDQETLDLAELELGELLSGTFFDGCPVFEFSHRRPELVTGIMSGIDVALKDICVRRPDAPFRMWIDQVRSIRGHGTVVSGTVATGILRCNDQIELLPSETKARARYLESHGCAVTQAITGQRVGINLHRMPVGDVRRGMSLVTPGTIHPLYLLNAEISMVAGAKRGIKNRQRVKIYLGTSITNAMVVFMERDRLEPGESGLAQIRLMRPVAALPRDAFVISPLNINTVIAGGRILETPREKYRAVKAKSILPLLTALQKGDVGAYVEKMFDGAQNSLISAKALSEKTGLPPAPFERIINSRVQKGEFIYLKGHGAIEKRHLTVLKKEFKTIIEEAFSKDPMKRSVGMSEVAERLESGIASALLKTTAEALCTHGDIIRVDGGYRPAGDQPSLYAFQDPQVSFLLDYMQAAGLTPISPAFFWKQHQSQYSRAKAARLFNYLYSQKELIRLNDNRFLSLKAFEEIKRRVARAIAVRGYITLGDCKELFGYGRSGGAHVLDYLNQTGFTVRKEDKHYLSEGGPR
jgi:selenocysteine-specific elongation factor